MNDLFFVYFLMNINGFSTKFLGKLKKYQSVDFDSYKYLTNQISWIMFIYIMFASGGACFLIFLFAMKSCYL